MKDKHSSRQQQASSLTNDGAPESVAVEDQINLKDNLPNESRPGLSATAIVAVLALLSFVFTYLADGMRPGADYPLGWYQFWYDQSKYFDMLTSLPKGNLGEFQYPPLYPLLGALGQVFYRKDPFFVVDLGLFLVYILCSYRVLRRFLSPCLAVIASCLLVQVSVDLFTTPWTSTLSAAAMSVLLDILTAGEYTIITGLIAGLCGGTMFGARIGDVFPAALVASAVFLDGTAKLKQCIRFALAALTSGCVLAGLVIAINLHFGGQVLGNYFSGILRQGFVFFAIPFKLYGYFIDPYVFHRDAHPYSHAAIFRLPLLLLAPLGLFLFFDGSKFARRDIGRPLLLAVIGWCVIYVPFIAVTAITLRYGSIHYLKIIFPALIGAAFYAVGRVTQGRESGSISMTKIVAVYAAILCVGLFGTRLLKPPKINTSTAILSSNTNPSRLRLMIDGDPGTRWDSNSLQQPGMEFTLDLLRPRYIQRIVLDTKASPNDYPGSLSIRQSQDGKNWTSWWCQEQSVIASVSDCRSDPRSVRFLKFKLDKATPNYYWSVHELSLYGW